MFEQRVLARIVGGVQEAAEAARVVEAQRQPGIEQQVEVIVLQARRGARHGAQVARHPQVQQQRSALEPEQQVLGAAADLLDAAPGQLARQPAVRSASAGGDRRR